MKNLIKIPLLADQEALHREVYPHLRQMVLDAREIEVRSRAIIAFHLRLCEQCAEEYLRIDRLTQGID